MFLRSCLVYGNIAWITAGNRFYKRLRILERHALRIAYRIKLPSPTQLLYDRITFPEILKHLEKLRLNYITKRWTKAHPTLLDTIHAEAQQDIAPRYHHSPLQHLLELYRLANNDDPTLTLEVINLYPLPAHSADIYPTHAN